MRLALVVVAVTVLAALPASPTATATPVGVNLLANPGFELGSPTSSTPAEWNECCSPAYEPTRVPLAGLNTTYGLAIDGAFPYSMGSVLRSGPLSVEGANVIEFGASALGGSGIEFRLEFFVGGTHVLTVAAPHVEGVSWAASRGRVVVPALADSVQFTIDARGPVAALVDDAYLVIVAANLFTEEWTDGLDGWNVTGAGASHQCAPALHGCSLRLDPAPMPDGPLRVQRAIDLALPVRTEASTFFLGSSTTGPADAELTLGFSDGSTIVVRLTGAPGDNQIVLDVSGSPSQAVYDWRRTDIWYRVVVKLDFEQDTARLEVRGVWDNWHAGSDAIPFTGDAELAFVRFGAEEPTQTARAFSFDRFVVREDMT